MTLRIRASGDKGAGPQQELRAGARTMPAVARLGDVEYVVESRRDGDVETWLIVRPLSDIGPQLASYGMAFSPGCRIVLEARSLRPVGVLEADVPPAPSAAGFNPYFDLRPA